MAAIEVQDFRLSGKQPVNMQVTAFSVGKAGDELNEDRFGFNTSALVFADGSTAKNAAVNELFMQNFGGKTGGRVAAELACRVALESGLNGRALIDADTQSIVDLYQEHFPDLVTAQGEIDTASRIATTFAVVTFEQEKGLAVCTQLGDTAIRVAFKDGTVRLMREERHVDVIDAELRRDYVQRELARAKADGVDLTPEQYKQILADGRKAIEPRLAKQWMIWNNPSETVPDYDPEIKYPGFGYVNGSPIPDKFIKVENFPLSDLRSIELISDGYMYADSNAWPAPGSDVQSWEDHISQVHAADPDKIDRYPATKPMDDRGIVIATFR